MQVLNLTGVTAIAGGWYHSLAIAPIPPCTLTCTATVPSTGQTGDAISFQATAAASNCTGTPTFDWDFGDGSAHSSQQNPSHTYASAGTYNWTMTATVDGVTCVKIGTVTVTVPCILTCTATVSPTPCTAPLSAAFTATTTTSGCTGTPAFDWDFGDGTAHSSQQNPGHTYASAGTYDWTMTTSLDGQTCAKSSSITIVTPPVVGSIKKGQAPGRPSTFRIKIFGSYFDPNCVVYIGGDTTAWANVKWKNSGKIVLKKGRKLKTKFPKGVCTSIRIVNPDGGAVCTGFKKGKGGGMCTP